MQSLMVEKVTVLGLEITSVQMPSTGTLPACSLHTGVWKQHWRIPSVSQLLCCGATSVEFYSIIHCICHSYCKWNIRAEIYCHLTLGVAFETKDHWQSASLNCWYPSLTYHTSLPPGRFLCKNFVSLTWTTGMLVADRQTNTQTNKILKRHTATLNCTCCIVWCRFVLPVVRTVRYEYLTLSMNVGGKNNLKSCFTERKNRSVNWSILSYFFCACCLIVFISASVHMWFTIKHVL